MKNIIIAIIIAAFFSLSGVAQSSLDLRYMNTITMTPNPVAAGSSVTFSVNWKNFGGAVDNLKVIGGVDGTQILLKTYPHLDAAIPQKTESFSWTTTAESHTAWFEIDPDQTCGDTNYSNNRIEMQFTVEGGSSSGLNVFQTNDYHGITNNSKNTDISKPGVINVPPKSNLKIQSVSFPSNVADGDQISYSVEVKNTGAIETNCAVILKYSILGNEINNHTVPQLSPGETFTVNGTWTAVCTGACNSKPSFKIDFYNLVDEGNEDDNVWEGSYFCACHSINITHNIDHSSIANPPKKPGFNTGQGKPNLKIEVIYNPSVPQTLTCDGRVDFTIKIKNTGNAAVSQAFKYYKYYRDDLVYFGYCDPLGPGEEYISEQNFQLITCNSQCISLWKFVVDPENVIAESDESDNTFTVTMNCSCN